jgi:IS605 OrfB family transposase
VATELPLEAAQADVVERLIPPQVAARLAAVQAKKDAGLVDLTAIVPVHLPWKQHLAAHEACHAAALLWNQTVDWLHAQWRAKKSPKKEDIRRYVTALPAEARPFHAHTAQAVAYDLNDALATMRENKKAGRKARAPWREKKYRPLSFTKDFGWRITPEGQLALSLGRGRDRILLPLPEVVSRDGVPVGPGRWGEIRLCWSITARRWTLHISYGTPSNALPAAVEGGLSVTVAIDEGVINPMALSARMPDGSVRVEVLNGRSGRSIKRLRNKQTAGLQAKLSRCKNGSRRHRRLTAAKKQLQAKTERRLHDFDHQVTARAEKFTRNVHTAWTEHHAAEAKTAGEEAPVVGVRIVAGDVRGIERHTNKKRRASRSTRQQLSQWSRGRQEQQLAYKTGLTIEHVSEAYTSQTCVWCLHRAKPRGRNYICKNPDCSFKANRDATGSVNIGTLADNDGTFVPYPDLRIEVTYRRPQSAWSPLQRPLHSWHQQTLGRAGVVEGREGRRSARNRATTQDPARVLASEAAALRGSAASQAATAPTGPGRTAVHAT